MQAVMSHDTTYKELYSNTLDNVRIYSIIQFSKTESGSRDKQEI